VLPTPIDTERFVPQEPRLSQSARTIIGWIGNPTGVPYLDELANSLRGLAKVHDFEVHVVGGTWECDGVKVVCRDWSRDTEVQDTQSFDIGVMPLPDSEWTRGKCSFKLIQYMSCGIPAVASPVGMNREVIREGVNGFVAGSEDEWVEKLGKLLENEGLRRRMGEAGRSLVVQEYSVKALGPRFVEVLRNLLLE
jgi:glycosyltransferase involved in cell wall biosynthesis